LPRQRTEPLARFTANAGKGDLNSAFGEINLDDPSATSRVPKRNCDELFSAKKTAAHFQPHAVQKFRTAKAAFDGRKNRRPEISETRL
jgi:hypothetical protein